MSLYLNCFQKVDEFVVSVEDHAGWEVPLHRILVFRKVGRQLEVVLIVGIAKGVQHLQGLADSGQRIVSFPLQQFVRFQQSSCLQREGGRGIRWVIITN